MRLLFAAFLTVCVLCSAVSGIAEAEAVDVAVSGALGFRDVCTGDTDGNYYGKPITLHLAPDDILQVLSYTPNHRPAIITATGTVDGTKKTLRNLYYGDDMDDKYYQGPYFLVPAEPGKTLVFSAEGWKFSCNDRLYGIAIDDNEALEWLKGASEEDLAGISYVRVGDIPAEGISELARLAGRPLVVELVGKTFEASSPVLEKLDLRGLVLWEARGKGEIVLPGREKLQLFAVVKSHALKRVEFSGPLPALKTVSLLFCERLADFSGLSQAPGLSYLNITWAKFLKSETLTGCPQLKGICLRGCAAITSLALLQPGKGIAYVDLRFCSALKSVSELRACVSAKQLLISDSAKLSDLSMLVDLTALEELEVSNCPAVVAIPDLGNDWKLERLVVSNCGLRDMDFVSGVTSLNALDASGLSCITDLKWLADLRALDTLELNSCPNLTSFAGLADMPSLIRIKANGSAIESLQGIEVLTLLGSLEIENCTNLRDIASLANTVTLKSLMITGSSRIESFAPLKNLSCISYLSLSSPADADFGPLGELTGMKYLYIVECPGMKTLDFCERMTGLSMIDLVDCPDLENIEGLSGLQNMKYVTINKAPTLSSVRALFDKQSLQYVFLHGIPAVKAEEIAELKASLPKCQVMAF
ncbi:MAG: hypothetical protein WC712_02565 [Candidatus Brocadiia bacterium]